MTYSLSTCVTRVKFLHNVIASCGVGAGAVGCDGGSGKGYSMSKQLTDRHHMIISMMMTMMMLLL